MEEKKKSNRKSGILMHISSLPSKYGIGKIGKAAYDFVDFLKKSGTKCWQILPLSPTGYGDSPYQSFSVNAGNPYFIDFDFLAAEGLLKKSDYDTIKWDDSSSTVNYSKIYENIFSVLSIAFNNFTKDPQYDKFTKKNSDWLDNYALFMALKNKYGGKPWYEWDKKLAMRDKSAIEKVIADNKKEIDFQKFLQYKFFSQWFSLKKYANSKGIELIGDMPIYAAYDSVECWCNPELFLLDRNKKPIDVAGCPPDIFSITGQLWGNPLYNWDFHKKQDYKWWRKRIEFSAKIYDIVRIDHFRGFESFYAIPYSHETAENGEWRKGPGAELFKSIEQKNKRLNLIAEDLGFITEDVREMLDTVGYPGMKVLQFAFDNPKSEYLPHNYKTANLTVYTGTHDNPTLQGWLDTLDKKSLKFALKYLNVKKKKQIPKAAVRLAWSSIANLAVAQIQDFLDADESGRMNTPSTLGCNWLYRTKSEDFTPALAKYIKSLNKLYNR